MKAVVVALCMTGCAIGDVSDDVALEFSSETVPTPATCTGAFAIRNGFSAEQSVNIQEAMKRWNAFIGTDIVVENMGASCRIEPGRLEGFVGYHAAGVVTIDLAQAPTDPRWFQQLVMHEIGHVLGLEHVAGGIMAANNLSATADFSDDDRRECSRVHVCR